MLLTRELALVWAALNAPFLLFRPDAPLIEEPLLRSLGINLVLFIAPGLPLAGVLLKRRGQTPETAPLWIVSASAAVLLAVLLISRPLGPPDAARLWTLAWLATNASMLAALKLGGFSPRALLPERKTLLAGAAVFLAAYAAYFQGASRFVPPLDDQDYEAQGTGWGLLASLSPALTTDRGTPYYFAHPPLVHFYVAGSFAGWNELGRLKRYSESSNLEALYADFHRDPAPVPTRTANVFLAALTVALLGAAAARLSGRPSLGALTAAAFATNPEVFVRSSYGGYFAGEIFALMSLLLASSRADFLLAGAFAALVNQKLVFLPLALAAWRLREKREAHPALLGFAAGTALFWAWGLAIDASVFWTDHIRSHLLDRIVHVNPLGYGGYPDPAALWSEFVRHTGFLLLPLGAWAVADGLRRGRDRDLLGPWAVWMLMTSLAYTAVDWRQTKHLMPLLLPLFLAPARWASYDRRALRAAAAGLLFLLLWNLEATRRLCLDFAGFAVTPDW